MTLGKSGVNRSFSTYIARFAWFQSQLCVCICFCSRYTVLTQVCLLALSFDWQGSLLIRGLACLVWVCSSWRPCFWCCAPKKIRLDHLESLRNLFNPRARWTATVFIETVFREIRQNASSFCWSHWSICLCKFRQVIKTLLTSEESYRLLKARGRRWAWHYSWGALMSLSFAVCLEKARVSRNVYGLVAAASSNAFCQKAAENLQSFGRGMAEPSCAF